MNPQKTIDLEQEERFLKSAHYQLGWIERTLTLALATRAATAAEIEILKQIHDWRIANGLAIPSDLREAIERREGKAP